jgi:hypothetical protein
MKTRIQVVTEHVEENWKFATALRGILGAEFPASKEWNFGDVPTEKAELTVEDGRIIRIRTWSGLNWSARGGYGSPTVDISI